MRIHKRLWDQNNTDTVATAQAKDPVASKRRGQEGTIRRDLMADSGDSDGLYRGADGGGHLGRVRRIGGKEKRDCYEGLPAFNRNAIFVKKTEKLTLR